MEQDIKDIINNNDLVIWSLKHCQYSKNAKELSPVVKVKKEKLFIFDVDSYSNALIGNPLNDILNIVLNKYYRKEHKTYPKIFYKGHFLGGFTEFNSIVMNNHLKDYKWKKLR